MARVNLSEVLEVRNRGLLEAELWSVLCSTCEALQDVCLKGDYLVNGRPLPCIVTPFNLLISRAGRVNCDLNYISSDQLFRPPERELKDDTEDVDVERFLIFSVGMTLETARDFKAKKEPISPDLSQLLAGMREEIPKKRISIGQLLERCSLIGKRYVGGLSFSHYLRKLYRSVMGSNSELEQLENALKSDMARSWHPTRSNLMTRSLLLDDTGFGDDDGDQNFNDFVRSRKRRHINEDSNLMSPRSALSAVLSDPDTSRTDTAVAALHEQLLLSHAPAGPGVAGALERVQARRRHLAGVETATLGSEDGRTSPPSQNSFVHGTFHPGGGLKMGRDGSDGLSTVDIPVDSENGPPAYGRQTINASDAVLRSKTRRDVGDLSDFEFAVAYADGKVPDRPDGSVKEEAIVPRAERNVARSNRISQISAVPNNEERKMFGPEFVAMQPLQPKRINIPDYVPKKGSMVLKEVEITLLNGERLQLSCEPDTVGQSLLDAVLDYMAIPEHYYFGIAYVKEGESYFIEPETKLHKVAPKEWREAGKNRHGSVLNLVFHMHLKTKFYPDCVHRMNHATPRHLLYLQLRRDILDERYPLPSEELFCLCGLALQAEYGDYSTKATGRGYCHAEHYLPASVIRQFGLTAAEERLVSEHKANPGLAQAEAEIRFIEQLQQQQLYGVHLYKVSRDKNDRSGLLYLGVDSVGLKIVEMRGTVQTVLLDYPWLHIEKISFNKRRFSILPKTDVKIGQKQIAKASYYTSSYRKGRYLLRFCTDQHTFRLRHKTDWESNNAGTDNPSYIHAEDIDDFESEGMLRVSSRVRMRKVLPSPSPEDVNGLSDNFIGASIYPGEDIFVDYSTDEDMDRESEEVVSPRRHNEQNAVPKGLGDFFELEQAAKPQDTSIQLALLEDDDGVGADSPRESLTNNKVNMSADLAPSVTRRSGRNAASVTDVGGKENLVNPQLAAITNKEYKSMPDVLTNGDVLKNNKAPSYTRSISSASTQYTIDKGAARQDSYYSYGSGLSLDHEEVNLEAMRGRPSTGSGCIIPPPPAFDGDADGRSSSSSRREAFEPPQPRKRRSPRRLVRADAAEGMTCSTPSMDRMTSSSPEKTQTSTPDSRRSEMEVILRRSSGSLGLNVTGGVNTSVRDGGIYVKSIIRGSCADDSGEIFVGDRVLSVDDISVTGMTHREAVELLRASGPQTRLKIRRDPPQSLDLTDFLSSAANFVDQPSVVSCEEVELEKVVEEFPLLEDQLASAFILTIAFPKREPGSPPHSLGLHLLDPMPEELALDPSEQFVRISRPAESCPESLRRVLHVGDLLLESNEEPLTSTDEVRTHLHESGPDCPMALLIARPHKAGVAEEVAEGDIVNCQFRPPSGHLGLALAGSAEVTGGCYVRSVSPSASGQGLRPGDKLLAANGMDMTSMSHAEATDFLESLDAPISITCLRPLGLSSDNEDAGDDEDEEEEEEQFDVYVPSSSASVTPLSMQLLNQTPAGIEDSPPVPMRRRRLLNDSGIGLARPHSYAENLRRRPSLTDSDVAAGSLTTRSSEAPFNVHGELKEGKSRHVRCKSEPNFEERDRVGDNDLANKVLQPKTRVMRITLQKPDLSSSLGFSIVTIDKENLKGVFIKSIVPNGLADLDGRLKINDRLLQISGESVIGLTNKKVVSLLKKPRPSVTVAISRPFAAIEGGATAGPEWTPGQASSLEGLSTRDSVHSADKSLSDSSSVCHVKKDLQDIFQEYGLTVNNDLDGLVASNIEHSALNPDLFDLSERSQVVEPETRRQESSASSKVDLDDLLTNNVEASKLFSISGAEERNATPTSSVEKAITPPTLPPPDLKPFQLCRSPTPEMEVDAVAASPLASEPSPKAPEPPTESPSLLASVTHRLLGDHALEHLTDEYVEGLPLLQLPASSRLHDPDELGEVMEEVREAMDDDGAGDEYRDMRMALRKEERDCECGQREVNKPRNRYRNVLPYDATRVRLRDVEISDSDYINASHIRLQFGARELRLIAAQGPVPSTVDHFWQMVVEQGVKVIAMVTQAIENDKVKCHVYWPSSRTEILEAGKYHIQLEEETSLRSVIVRRFHVIKPSTNRVIQRVFHLNFTNWPDQGIPESATPLLHYVSMLREMHASLPFPGPLLVHCSAGIGRTGALITLLCLANALEADLVYSSTNDKLQPDQFNIPTIVRKLRSMRPGMIQTKDQYVFCYVALLELLNFVAQDRTALL